jgi:hypothetical protein
MCRWTLAAVLTVTACGFQSPASTLQGDASVSVDGSPRPDGAVSTSDDVVHVATTDEYTGTDDLTISAPITIDTQAMAFGMPLPPGATFTPAKQDGGGPDLAILHVRKLAVHATVRALGSRPLVVIADSIELTETIDVTAHHSQPGPGALSPGPGAGHDGQHVDPDTDSGGGGGSHGSVGAAGGSTDCTACLGQRLDGGGAGGLYNLGIALLVGGSPGGSAHAAAPTSCNASSPGAGGGAIELYARTQISLSGYINAGGGGGAGGTTCLTSSLGGAGGGAGGAIVLQAPSIENSGRLSANGGGGGAGASGGADAVVGEGQDGNDGALGTAVATGGAASGPYGAHGGNGAAAATAATPGATGTTTSIATGNAGGGGGGTGQILMLYKTRVAAGVTSPTAITQPY